MNPQLQSILTSVGMTAATAATTWGVAHGLVPGADQASVANALVTLGLAVVTGLIGWWKARQTSQKAMIQAVNAADNGFKVVPVNSTTAPPVQEPQK